MKVLIVSSFKSTIEGGITWFIKEQAESLQKMGIEIDYFLIRGKGITGYLKNYSLYIKKIKEFGPDLIHAHYGLSGLFANLQRKIPVVTTYHGSDINDTKVFRYSGLAIKLSKANIFVSQKNMEKGRTATNNPNIRMALIPCGVDTELFQPMDKLEARKVMHLNQEENYILFSGSFTNKVKNPELARAAVSRLPDVNLIELKGYTRTEVMYLMNAVDMVLMTSYTEGSPQFIKEAMACNCPVVSVPVGDVPDVITGTEGCILVDYSIEDIINSIKKVLENPIRTNGRVVISKFDIIQIVNRIIKLYSLIIDSKLGS